MLCIIKNAQTPNIHTKDWCSHVLYRTILEKDDEIYIWSSLNLILFVNVEINASKSSIMHPPCFPAQINRIITKL